ncbi:30S ribosomal protein S4e [Candidatus Woesearchaeota archaeon]|nr:MAG: 30S ribosomal protein S4e [Candidatus Woesearchaeota archaeon]
MLKMVKRHLKQLAAPKSWPLKRKGSKFVTMPEPGAHKLEEGVPLALMLTNMINVAENTAEAKKIIYKSEVLVDQVRRKSPKFMVGFMDTVEFPQIKKAYRILFNSKGTLVAHEIDVKEAKIKPVRVENKRIVKGNKIQLNLSSGRNILVEKDEFNVGDTLVLELPEQKIKSHIKLEPGSLALLVSSKHMGLLVEVAEVQGDKVIVKKDDKTFETAKETVFVVGKKKPEITIPQEE